MKNIMKNTILTLFAIVALASCGNKTTKTNSDSTVVDSTMCDSSTSDSAKCCNDTASVEKVIEKK
jgi:predicted small lipoprotein YifL